MKKDYVQFVSECDTLIKVGRINEVAAQISELNLSKIPREHCQAVGKICRRAGLIEKGLRLLFPIIRRSKELGIDPTPGEICEYSVLLSRNGSVAEALELLLNVSPAHAPEALLYRAFCAISCWDYGQAIVDLTAFLQCGPDNYSKLIAQVNLASAFLATDNLEQAKVILDQTIQSAKEANANRLAGNCFELRGQAHLFAGDFVKARADFEAALAVFGHSQSYDQLLVLKWQHLMHAQETKSIAPLLNFRTEALQRHHWESVREADLFSLQIDFDQSRFDHLVIGTALPKYRERIQKLVPYEASEFFVLGDSNGPLLNLETGAVEGIDDLNPGKKIHQMISALTQDLYVPRNVGTLFNELYPEEYFDVNSSSLRIRQIITRVRRWATIHALPIEIVFGAAGYQLIVRENFGISIPRRSETVNSLKLRWLAMSRAFPQGCNFSNRDACKKLNMSSSSFQRLVEWALQNGLVEKSGIGRGTTYRILENQNSQQIKNVV